MCTAFIVRKSLILIILKCTVHVLPFFLFVQGDFLEVEKFLEKGVFDHIVSWLTVLHFNNRLQLFRASYNLLKPGGHFYVADLCRTESTNGLTVKERQKLREEVYCYDLGTSSQLIAESESVGFRLKETIYKTDEWKKYVIDR